MKIGCAVEPCVAGLYGALALVLILKRKCAHFPQLIFEAKDDYILIAIAKNEAEIIRNKYPRVHIVRTLKQKSKRHHYFVAGEPKVLALLNKIRGRETVVDLNAGRA